MRWMNIILLLLCIAGLCYSADLSKVPKTGGREVHLSTENTMSFVGLSAKSKPDVTKKAAEETGAEAKNAGDDEKRLTEGGEKDAAAKKQRIRVLIKTQDFAGDYHKNLSLVCNSITTTKDGNHTFQAGEEIAVDTASPLFDQEGHLVLIPEDETAGFTVTSLKRAQGVPVYEGTMEIYRLGEGLLLINELDLETYLRYVVPSEMPSTYEAEALKAQAVCARTYAFKQIRDGALTKLHADVDDSVSFQVYNNIARQPSTDAAVEATKGQIMKCDGEPITAYFFSTSSGFTSTNEVWQEEPEKYLQCVNSGSLESSEPWFRWKVTLPIEYLNQQIARYQIGTLQGIMILKKSQGGAVEELKLVGSLGEKIVGSEYTIRELFSTKGIPVTRQDGTVTTEMDLMPSAYFSCTPVQGEEGLTGFLFEGGGYGHGVGMSQNGANHLAKQGKNWQEILDYFYAQIDLCPIL